MSASHERARPASGFEPDAARLASTARKRHVVDMRLREAGMRIWRADGTTLRGARRPDAGVLVRIGFLAFLLMSASHAVRPQARPSHPSGSAQASKPVESPASGGVDTASLAAFSDSITAGAFGLIDGLVVMRDGRIVFKRMFPRSYVGAYPMTDSPGPFNYHHPHWHPYYEGTSLHTQQSVTKSITSLYGIAFARGDISSIGHPIEAYFPAYARFFSDPRKQRITVGHLLTMTSGIHWPDGASYDTNEDPSSLTSVRGHAAPCS